METIAKTPKVFRVRDTRTGAFIKDADTLTKEGVIMEDFDQAKEALLIFCNNTHMPLKDMRIICYSLSELQTIRIDDEKHIPPKKKKPPKTG